MRHRDSLSVSLIDASKREPFEFSKWTISSPSLNPRLVLLFIVHHIPLIKNSPKDENVSPTRSDPIVMVPSSHQQYSFAKKRSSFEAAAVFKAQPEVTAFGKSLVYKANDVGPNAGP